MRIFLVDDEPAALDYLAHLVDWPMMGHSVVGALGNPFAALEACERERVDLLITDIRMPGLDGIELSRRLKRTDPRLMVVLLTGYKDFEYAWRAVGIHAEAYLLKDELTERVLTMTLAQCELRRNTLYKDSVTEKQLLLRDILLGDGFARQRLALSVLRLGLITPNQEFSLFPNYDDRYSLDMPDLSALNALGGDWQAMFMLSGQGVFAATWDRPGSDSQPFWDALAAQMEHGMPMQGYLLLLPQPIADAQTLARCYRQCLWGSEHLIFLRREGCVIRLVDERRISDTQHPGVEACLERLRKALREEAEISTEDALRALFQSLLSAADMDQLRGTVFALISMLEQFQQSAAMPLLRDDGQMRGSRFVSLDQLRLFFARQFTRTIEYAGSLRRNTSSPVLNKALKWMCEHYGENISLTDVADAVSVSSVYLSQLFRKYAETTFSEKLTQMRIQAGKHLLQHTNLKIYDIARQTGFQKSQYFAQVFKACTNLTPLEYRGKSGGTGK